MTDLFGRQISHRIPRNRKPIWDIETVDDMVKGVIAVILAGVAIGLVAATGRILWELSDHYAYAIALWITGVL